MPKIRFEYGLKYWKLAVHLIFKTQHFGVNNMWWVKQPSSIGWPWYEVLWGILTIMPIIRTFLSQSVRACLRWMPQAEREALGFGHQL